MIGRPCAESVRRPHEWLAVKLTVAGGHRRAMREEDARALRPTLVRGRVQRRLADLLVRVIDVESAGEHRLEGTRVVPLRGTIQRSVVLGPELARELGRRGEHLLG